MREYSKKFHKTEKIFESKKSNYYIKDGSILVDGVDVNSSKILGTIEFVGLASQTIFTYKNGNKQRRWKLTNSIDPHENPWFVIEAEVSESTRNLGGWFCMAVRVHEDTIEYAWLSRKLLRHSTSILRQELSVLDIARVESTIEHALSEVG